MGLLRHPRQTARDVDAWARWEREDAINATLPRLAKLEDRALADLRTFAAAGPCWSAVSWGKDSTVLAHMSAQMGMPLVWFRKYPNANPDCVTVRDAFLSAFDTGYTEIGVHVPVVDGRFGLDIDNADEWGRYNRDHQRRVMGIRAQENRERKLRAMRWGVSTASTCAPLSFWTDADVFAYLHRHDLPIHPAYACSMGGAVPRGRIRVDALGGETGTGHGRAEWEVRYYGREMAAMVEAAGSPTAH